MEVISDLRIVQFFYSKMRFLTFTQITGTINFFWYFQITEPEIMFNNLFLNLSF